MWLPFAWLISAGGCYGVVQVTTKLTKSMVGAFASRKLCHLGAGTIFAMTWPLFSDGAVDAIVASSVVWASSVKFILVGTKIVHDPEFASSMGAASGQEHTLLQGPAHYGAVIASLTMFKFKRPSSIIPIGVLCGGDAVAALIGRHFGKQRWPWNNHKTIVGTAAFVAGAISVTFGLLLHMNAWDTQDRGWLSRQTVLQTLMASVVGAAVETVPSVPRLGNIDNLLIPASSMLVMRACSV